MACANTHRHVRRKAARSAENPQMLSPHDTQDDMAARRATAHGCVRVRRPGPFCGPPCSLARSEEHFSTVQRSTCAGVDTATNNSTEFVQSSRCVGTRDERRLSTHQRPIDARKSAFKCLQRHARRAAWPMRNFLLAQAGITAPHIIMALTVAVPRPFSRGRLGLDSLWVRPSGHLRMVDIGCAFSLEPMPARPLCARALNSACLSRARAVHCRQ